MSAIDEKGRNKMLIIKGILAEKCGLTTELYDELGRELDELMMIVGRNKSEGEKQPDTASKLNIDGVSNNEAAVCDCTEPNAEDNAGNKWCSKCYKMYHLAN